MIISHEHRYLYIAVPHTGTTAISDELRNLYGGQEILDRNSNYQKFLRITNPEEKEYYVFSGVRNPLDLAVSLYFRYVTNHHEEFTNPKAWKSNGGWVNQGDIQTYQWIQSNNIEFPEFFKSYFRIPYDNLSLLLPGDIDYIIRFEHLQAGFSEVLIRLGIQQKRSLPARNVTAGRKRDFLSNYPPELHPFAMRIFGPFMQKWGYEFPSEWGIWQPTLWNRLEFAVLSALRRIYWGYLKPRKAESSQWFVKNYLYKPIRFLFK